jgi:hypothetical protein
MKKTILDLAWLPPREEWDFRAVAPTECRVACHWEYARQIRQIGESAIRRSLERVLSAKQPAGLPARSRSLDPYCPVNYRQPARELFPQAWLNLTQVQRASVLASFYPVPAVQVRKLGDFLQRMQWGKGAHLDALRPWLEHTYVVQPNFSLCGVEAVIRELKAWARREAKNYPPAPRAKSAELPFDALKWLAVLRLEDARRKSNVRFEPAQQALLQYRRRHVLADRNAVFPNYASPGAWSKARADARRCLNKVLSQPAFLLAGLS